MNIARTPVQARMGNSPRLEAEAKEKWERPQSHSWRVATNLKQGLGISDALIWAEGPDSELHFKKQKPTKRKGRSETALVFSWTLPTSGSGGWTQGCSRLRAFPTGAQRVAELRTGFLGPGAAESAASGSAGRRLRDPGPGQGWMARRERPVRWQQRARGSPAAALDHCSLAPDPRGTTFHSRSAPWAGLDPACSVGCPI